jgi:CHAT domain-containing protein
VRRESVRLVPLGPSRNVVARASAWLKLVATKDAPDVEAALACYDRLVRPLEPALVGATRWLLVPDGPLAFLPFDALARGSLEKPERLVASVECALVPSAGVYAALAAEAAPLAEDGRVLAVGAPTPPRSPAAAAEFPPLPGSADEARETAERVPAERRVVLVGADATPDRVLAAFASEGPRFSTLHFACHGVVDVLRTHGTGLLLAEGDVLDADRLARAHVPADLAVLSACDSGKGAQIRGEGVYGLARAFFLAGVPRVMVTQWAISDATTRAFMRRFHAGRAAGKAPGAALTDAKREAIAEGGSAAHPSEWAAFVLWGLAR